ncbi:hypothetical protein PENSPDRAFT_659473 [Peniophora sp. CONT]|nr:hypothetical protein PENSPDRAFT_659473 [Peniophora sp. CONT]
MSLLACFKLFTSRKGRLGRIPPGSRIELAAARRSVDSKIEAGNAQHEERIKTTVSLTTGDTAAASAGRESDDDAAEDLETVIKRYANTSWAGFKLLLKVLKESSDGLTPLKATVGGLVALIEIYDRTKSNAAGTEEVAQRLDRLMHILAKRLDEDEKTASSLITRPYIKTLQEQLAEVTVLGGHGRFQRTVESAQDEETLKSISGTVANALQEFQLEIGLSAEKDTRAILQETVLQNLGRAKAAAYTAAVSGISRRSCTPGTRDGVLADILTWALDESDDCAPVYWMSGLAGQGKTTIAHTICERLEHDRQDVSMISFFCSRQLDSSQEKLLVSTLAFELAESSASYATELLHALQAEHNLGDQKLSVQMSKLLVGPWSRSAYRREGMCPIVLVVDALDENEAGTEFVELILLASRRGQLAGLRILITSRPEPDIVHLCKPIEGRAVCHLNDVPWYLVQKEILLYLEDELPEHRGEHYLVDVANASDGVFIYAATILRMVKSSRRRRTRTEQAFVLRQLADQASTARFLGNGQSTVLDELYKRIVDDAFRDLRPVEREIRENVLMTALGGSLPLELPWMAYLANVDDQLAWMTLEALHPVLYIGEYAQIHPHHASFTDFIYATYQTRMPSIWINIVHRSMLLTAEAIKLFEQHEWHVLLTFTRQEWRKLEECEANDPTWPAQGHARVATNDAIRFMTLAYEKGISDQWTDMPKIVQYLGRLVSPKYRDER